MAEWLRRLYLRDMECTVHDLGLLRRSWVQTPVGSKLRCIVPLSKLYLNKTHLCCKFDAIRSSTKETAPANNQQLVFLFCNVAVVVLSVLCQL